MINTIELEHRGYVFQIPACVVASHRAAYYKGRAEETGEDFDFNAECNYLLNDEYELLDWLRNNMNPEDIDKANIKLIKSGNPPTFEEAFTDHDDVTEWSTTKLGETTNV